VTLPASGSISLGQVATELGVALPISLGDTNVRTLAGVASGAISLTNLYGKTAGAAMSAAAPNILAQRSTNTTGVVSGTSTATPTGGTAPYTYAWAISGASQGMAAGGTTTATLGMSKSCAPGALNNETWVCTVTDSAAHSATATISVELDGFPI
jgi:hypothetical protein